MGKVSIKVVKRIVIFEILNFDFFWFFFPFNMVFKGNYKMCDILETAALSETDQNLGLRSKYVVYTGYF